MKKILLITTLFLISKIPAQTWANDDQYIQKFAVYAVEEMLKYKIPASITLAQGLLETGGGQSILAQQGKNHFGIKCHQNWTGKTMTHNDDRPNECFRVYEDPRDSYNDHSLFLTGRKHYEPLFALDPKDYKSWANGLKKAGYATNPRYAQILISKIEKYRLYEFDQCDAKTAMATVLKLYPALMDDKVFMAKLDTEKASSAPKTVVVPYKPVSYAAQQVRAQAIRTNADLLSSMIVKNHPNGGLKFVVAPVDTNLEFISKKFGIPAGKLQKWNDLDGDYVRKNDIIFLEPKRTDGNVAEYRAEFGEDLHDISQKFAIRLDKLSTKNRMSITEKPRMGQIIYLQDKKPL